VKVHVVIPLKENSERLPQKNMLYIGEYRLFEWAIRAALATEILDELILFSSTSIFLDSTSIRSEKLTWLERPSFLDLNSSSITEVLTLFCEFSDADIVVLLHATSPFITPATINLGVNAVSSGNYDSAFATLDIQKFAWYRGKPLTYEPSDLLPRTQDLDPIKIEQSGLYIFKRVDFLKSKSRIGQNPYFLDLKFPENIDIDEQSDFEIACQVHARDLI
jgi:CMP-N-acetylneuraminic acid synthetase